MTKKKAVTVIMGGYKRKFTFPWQEQKYTVFCYFKIGNNYAPINMTVKESALLNRETFRIRIGNLMGGRKFSLDWKTFGTMDRRVK